MEIEINSTEYLAIAKAKKQLLFWSMASMVIFFAAFCSYYLVIQGNGHWLVFNLPALFFVSTAIIILSSGTMLLTFLLGIGFCFSQLEAWKALYANGIVFAGRNSNLSGSILYVITFMHFMHIIGGLIALFFTSIRALKNKYTPQNHLGLTLCGMFWHFLDVLWVVLFLFLYLFR